MTPGAGSVQRRLSDAIVGGRRAADAVRSVLAGAGLSLEGWLVLVALARQNGLIMSEIAERTRSSNATLTRHVDTLVQQALVYREVVHDDRRQIAVYASRRGLALVSRLESELRAEEGPGQS
ncbi:MarR family winged helix-turn-helix transcriptional regulator [Raineyella sp. W15-4]|uniref:MarR family winged helix-turn-helix transcriptional regulator n=1 Tax=Raineyella sp. W15-4 TaxID=3081651 RepID=UPI00295592A6|nr:MarR family transcriptional regulator [Raineyella sp. W15-4]WOQ17462.1 MarR family transcriptional regulator [Raineyella sp. W15-4]